MTDAKLIELYENVFGGNLPNINTVRKEIENFLTTENITEKEALSEVKSNNSIVFFGEVMDGLHD